MSNNQCLTPSGNDSRRGVALIVVLGFLTIMVMMAVAFLTHARMERLVAGFTLEGMRGRQLLRTAVNAGMNDYSVFLWNNKLIVPSLEEDRMFVSMPSASAYGMNGRTIGDDNVSLLVGEAEDWVPRSYLEQPFNALDAVNDQAEWILVREDPKNSQSKILGRYAYVCFDMSGGIDANLVARTNDVAMQDVRTYSNRVRRSVRDVPMGLLKETVDANEFKRLRKGWKGFDSLQALIHLTDGYYIDGSAGYESGDRPAKPPTDPRWRDARVENARALDPDKVTDLSPFSLSAYRGGRYDLASATWTRPTVMSDAVSWPTLLKPLDFQFYPEWDSWIGNAIYDYTHSDPTPRGTDYPSPKNVPMFNEVAVTYQLSEDPDVANPGFSLYSLAINLSFEFWYPFPSEDNANVGGFTLPAPTLGGGAPIDPVLPNVQLWLAGARLGSIPVMPVQATPVVANHPVPAQWNSGNTPQTPIVITYNMPLTAPGGGGLPPGLALDPNMALNAVQPIYLKYGSANADMLPAPPNGISFPGTAAPLAAGSPSAPFSWAVTDPRLNHLFGSWVNEQPPSPGAINSWYTTPVALKTSGRYSDTMAKAEGMSMYCRNGPMQNPAELGFISVGKEWETIDLCTKEGTDLIAGLVTTGVYEQLAVNNWVVYTNGTINPHTRSTNVLMSAFFDLDVGEVPNLATDRRVGLDPTMTEANARTLAGQILDELDLHKKNIPVNERFNRSFQAGTDWARVEAMQREGALAVAGLNNNQRESLIRNTWGLFSPDNSMFTVVAVAQAIKEGSANEGIWDEADDMVTGERRAVALVWRDPFRNGTNPHHEMFIRMFRYLND